MHRSQKHIRPFAISTLFGYINWYYEYKTHTKVSVIANGHLTPTSDWY
jgi:hypothetical protein